MSQRHGIEVERDHLYGRARTWLRPRRAGWPMAEELLTTAPARVIDKQDKSFEMEWHALISGASSQLPLT
ncbi:hypothetical protein [Streptomyces mirabilis]|uniref:hypothetical protein n=1 Tax=Streptomyces mirabilis TaxID=68239 RepID=UPI0036CA90F5